MSTNRRLPSWIDGFLKYTENTEPRESYRRWTAISTIASALQRKCYLPWGLETFHTNMYIVLVGPPAARKGTAMREGKRFLDRIGIDCAFDEGSRQKLIANMKDHPQSSVIPETGELYTHSSITIISTELTVFLGYESKELLASLCKWFDCEARFVYDTVSRGKDEIQNVWVNLFGATTPGQLQVALPEGAVGSGFTSRVVFVFEEDKEKVVIMPSLSKEAQDLSLPLEIDLQEIKNMHGEFKIADGFLDLYSDWRMDGESRRIFAEPRLDYYVQRRPTHLFKLAMIYSAARSSEMVITVDDLAAAIVTLEEAEQKMPMTFQGIGGNPLAAVSLRILKVLAMKKKVAIKDLAKEFFNDVSSMQLGEILSGLEQTGQITVNTKSVPATVLYNDN